jgi:hypothetical protein
VFDLFRLMLVLPIAEAARRGLTPARAIALARAVGRCGTYAAPQRRERLRRRLLALDSRLPGGGNCYRRALVQMALDPESAAEPIYFGLVRDGGPRSGHAWLASDPPAVKNYDAEFAM